MNANLEAYKKSFDETEKKRQTKNESKIKRFDDVFRMLLIVITIIISIGSNSYGNVNSWSVLFFVLLSLVMWMWGHSIGSDSSFQNQEVWIKLYAWAFASLVAPIVFLKFALGVSTLSYEWVAFCTFISILSTFLPYQWLKEILTEHQKHRFLTYLAFVLLAISYMVNTGTLII